MIWDYKQSKAITLNIDLIQIGKQTKTLLLQQAKIRHSQPKSVKGHAAEGKGDHPCLECQSKRMGACRSKQKSTLREKRGYVGFPRMHG
ncbi:unnamed protein product [Prunus brigantina]